MLEVGDDGIGFHPERGSRRVKDGHFGLQGLTDLVADAGGSFVVDSAPGAGARVRVEVPIP